MFQPFHRLLASLSLPRRRRARRMMHRAPESFETRLVLSSVTGLENLESLTTHTNDTQNLDIPSQSSSNSADSVTAQTQGPISPAETAFDSETQVFPAAILPGDDLSSQQPPDFVFDSDSRGLFVGGFLPDEMRDLMFADADEMRRFRRPNGPHRHPPFPGESAVEDSTEVLFDSSPDSSTQTMIVDATADSPTAVADSVSGSNATKLDTDGFDGFVELLRAPRIQNQIDNPIPDSLTSEDAASSADVPLRQSHPHQEHQRSATTEENAAVQAAFEFFNRDTGGGFVDAGLDELHAAAGIAAEAGSAGLATIVETGIGRLNPFNDRSHSRPLTAVELRQAAETDASQEGEVDLGAEVALAGIVFGAVGLRSRSFERLGRVLRRAVGSLRSFFRM